MSLKNMQKEPGKKCKNGLTPTDFSSTGAIYHIQHLMFITKAWRKKKSEFSVLQDETQKHTLHILEESMYPNESKVFGKQDVATCLQTLCTAMGEGWISVVLPKFCGLGGVCVLPSYYHRGVCWRSHLTFFPACCGSPALPGGGIYLYSDATLQFLWGADCLAPWPLTSTAYGEVNR